ncbi:MAG: glycosyltransferase family 2 protein [Acidobacteriota bacterium]
MKKIVIIPAFNEEKNIEKVLLSVKEFCPDFDVVVINDGSTDKTSELTRKFDFVNVIDLPVNIGIGGAVQTGFIYSERNNYDITVQVDGDGQHKPSEVKKIIEPILKNEADVIIGSRFIEKVTFRSSLLRRIGIKLFYLTNKILLREEITDSTSGFRAYNRKAIEILSRNYPDDYPEPEAIYILKRKGIKIKEVHVEMEERIGGRSSISFFRAVYYMTKVFLSIFVLMLRKEK